MSLVVCTSYSHIISVCRLYTHTHSRLSFSAVTPFGFQPRTARDPPRETVDGPSQVLLLFFIFFSSSLVGCCCCWPLFFSMCSYPITSVCLFFWRFLLFWLLFFSSSLSIQPEIHPLQHDTLRTLLKQPALSRICSCCVALHTRHRRTLCVILGSLIGHYKPTRTESSLSIAGQRILHTDVLSYIRISMYFCFFFSHIHFFFVFSFFLVVSFRSYSHSCSYIFLRDKDLTN